jgi:hypothetical protein
MTKDRIKHFDDVVMRTRTQGLPLATIIQAAAFVTNQQIGSYSVFTINGFVIHLFPLIMLAGLSYVISVLILDITHFKLLLKAVDHALTIEKTHFEGKLGITKALTTKSATWSHYIGAYLFYAVIIIFGSIFALLGPNGFLK